MAIVANLRDGGSVAVDRRYTTPNRSNAGDPNGSVTPGYQGEIILDTTTKKLWKAQTLLNTGWTEFISQVVSNAH